MSTRVVCFRERFRSQPDRCRAVQRHSALWILSASSWTRSAPSSGAASATKSPHHRGRTESPQPHRRGGARPRPGRKRFGRLLRGRCGLFIRSLWRCVRHRHGTPLGRDIASAVHCSSRHGFLGCPCASPSGTALREPAPCRELLQRALSEHYNVLAPRRTPKICSPS